MSDGTTSIGADQRRLKRLIADAPRRFGLDLSGIKVLTEAASGPFVSTALIAACGGAEVHAVTRDSSYATARDVASATMSLAAELGVAERLTVSIGNAAAAADGCHIVTNLGFVRPIGQDIVAKLDPSAVVALMWEPWEFRAEDITLTALAARSIPLIGTREAHPLIATFRYVGALAGKLVLEAGIELVAARIVVVGSDPFGRATADWLEGAGTSCCLFELPLDVRELAADKQSFDAVVLVEHRDHRTILGTAETEFIARLGRDGAPVVRICGVVDRALLARHDVRVHPDREVRPGFMSVTTGYLGPRPVVDLHAGGLRASQDVVRARLAGALPDAAVAAAVNGGFALAFEGPPA